MEPFLLDTTGRDVHAEGALLRERGPVALVELPGGVKAWSVTRIDVLRRLLGDPRVSRDPRLHWSAWRSGEIREDWPLHIWVSARNMFTSYGGEHRRLRSLVSKAFTPRRTESLRAGVVAITDRLLAELDVGPAVTDLRAGFADPLPVEVICRLFGVPEESRPSLRKAMSVINDTTTTPERALANQQDVYRILNDLIAARRRDPQDDLTSELIAVREADSDRLTETELIGTLLLMLGAGHETTVNLLGNAITALLTNPEQAALVRSGERPWQDAVEETLRWQAPVVNLPLRYAVEDITVDGVTIGRGDAILTSFAAAGRDPAQHGSTGDTYDLTRPDKTHLAFGHGVHYCLGAPLARLEAEIALPALFARFPDLELAVPAGELRPLPSFISNGHQSLPVRLRA